MQPPHDRIIKLLDYSRDRYSTHITQHNSKRMEHFIRKHWISLAQPFAVPVNNLLMSFWNMRRNPSPTNNEDPISQHTELGGEKPRLSYRVGITIM